MMLLKPRRQGYWCAAIVLPTGYCCQLKLHVLAIRWGKQHDVVVVRCCGAGCVVDCGWWAEAEGAGGQGEQRGGKIFCRSRELSHLPSTFYLCLHSQHLVSSTRWEPWWSPQSTLFCQHIFLIWQIYLTTSLLSTQLPFSSHLLYPYLSHNFPRSRSSTSKMALPLLMIIPSTTECHKLGSFSL